jgi:DNA-directed RNA polymerase specialized sigma24 family protein
MDMGRLPSLLSRSVVRGRATSCRIRNFEEAVVFVIDVERCLKRLDLSSQELVARITLQEYTQAEAADLMGQSLRSVIRRYGEVLDRLTAIFLDAELLETQATDGCQGGRF